MCVTNLERFFERFGESNSKQVNELIEIIVNSRQRRRYTYHTAAAHPWRMRDVSNIRSMQRFCLDDG